ncbi:MAG: phosphonate utilization associated transcriptional regulator [Burkholderiaceae bacterium]|nr:phosphonate utilization associated transcriptional regulator [Burkholderiaceae bacterium]
MVDRSRTNGVQSAAVPLAPETTRASPPSIAMLRSASLSSAAQHEIERMILEGEIKAGAKLTEAWLSERLGVSRGPIREAFRMLEDAGLVRQEKNRGVFVREIPLEEALEIFDLRAAMDELVGRRLAETITAEQMKAVRGIVEKMDVAARTGDADAYHVLNLHFHDALVEYTGNRKLGSVYRKLVKELALYRRRNLRGESVMPHSAAEHRAILKAIASGDAEHAGGTMYDHVIESKHRALHGSAAKPKTSRARHGKRAR